MHFKFNDYNNSVGIRVDSEGDKIPFEKPEAFDVKEKIAGAKFFDFQKRSKPDTRITEQKREHSESEIKEAKNALGNQIRDILKSKASGLVNAEGRKVKDGVEFYDTDFFFMGTFIAKDVYEDEKIQGEIIEQKKKGTTWNLNEEDAERIEQSVDSAFSNGEIHRAVYLSYALNTINMLINDNEIIKKWIKKWRTVNNLDPEMTPADERELSDEIFQKFLAQKYLQDKFVKLREKESTGRLNSEGKKIITNFIRKFTKEKFFVESSKDGIIDTEKQAVNINMEQETAGENKFEMPKERENLEDSLIQAIHHIKEIVDDELDIDFIPVEKHFSENIKEKMESLLNRSGFVDENPSSQDAEEYWKELCELEKNAKEIIELEENGKVCVVYQEKTFYVDRRQETSLEDLEDAARSVVGEKYLRAFVYGIKLDFENYKKALQENPRWQDLAEGKKKEMLEEGIVFYVNEILNENGNVVEDKLKEKIYRYAFDALND